jgi:hypothetical protein
MRMLSGALTVNASNEPAVARRSGQGGTRRHRLDKKSAPLIVRFLCIRHLNFASFQRQPNF